MASQLYKGLDPLATTAPPVVNNLNSTSTTSALSAYQGKVLNDKVDGLIKETSFQATTNVNGVVSAYYYSVLVNKVIISAICTSESDSICLVGHYNYGCWIKVMNYDLEKIANTDVTIKIWYKDLDYNP